jgi:ssDNA-binding Zn-finger/Zn-ribbon topoisomerase 1
MGATFEYRCGKCGYKVELSLGVGFAAIESGAFACPECKELVSAPVKNLATERKLKPRCPKSRDHKSEPWEAPGPCPKCGSTIEGGEMIGLWD